MLSSGTAWQIIPWNANLKGKLRWFSHEERDKLKDKIWTVTKYISDTHGCVATVDFRENCEPLINPEE